VVLVGGPLPLRRRRHGGRGAVARGRPARPDGPALQTPTPSLSALRAITRRWISDVPS